MDQSESAVADTLSTFGPTPDWSNEFVTLTEVGPHLGSRTNPFRFAGQYQDPSATESGFYYLRARYYDPTVSQFVSVDPLASKTGRPYAYVSGDPLNQTDKAGLCSAGPFSVPIWGSGPCVSLPNRLPDYITVQVQIPAGQLAWGQKWAGVQLGFSYDRYGNAYFDIGPAVGYTAAAGLSANAGWINSETTPTEAQLKRYISGPTITCGGYYFVGAQAVNGDVGGTNKNDFGYELGVGNPEATASATYGWQFGPHGPLHW